MRLFRPRRQCGVGEFADAVEAFLRDNTHIIRLGNILSYLPAEPE